MMIHLARLLFMDFSDEMAARDEILRAADDPNAAPISIGPSRPTPPPTPPKPPPIPVAASGEMQQATPARPRIAPAPQDAVPSVMVNAPSTRVHVPADLANVLDLSENVGADSWMADGGTDLLSAARWKSVRNFLIVLVALAAIVVGAVFLARFLGAGKPQPQTHVVQPPPPDAAVKAVEVPIDAGTDNMRDNIVACSKFGFYSLAATARTTIYIDGKYIGETPLTRLPLPPGPHAIKAVGPRGKRKEMKIDIHGCQDTDSGTITW